MGNVLSIRSREEIPNIATIALTLGFIGVCAAGAISGTSAAITTGLVVIIGTFVVGGVVYYIWKPRSSNELGTAITMMELQQNTEENKIIERQLRKEAERQRREAEAERQRREAEAEKDRIFHETMKQIRELGNRLDSFTGKDSVIGQLNQFKLRLQNEDQKMNEDVSYREQAISAMRKIIDEMESMKKESLKKKDILELMMKNDKFDQEITSLSQQVMKEMRTNSPYFKELMDEIGILSWKNNNLGKEFQMMLYELDSKRIEPFITHKPLKHTLLSENKDFL